MLKNTEHNKKSQKSKPGINWAVKATVISFFMTIAFSLFSELIVRTASVYISALIVLLLVLISIAFDMIGTAMASAEQAPFVAMCSRKVGGAKEVLGLIKNTDKVCSICNDIVGDICGIVSGAATSAIIYNVVIARNISSSLIEMIFTIFFSAVVACLTIGGKAFGKTIALKRSKDILLLVGVFLSIFKKRAQTND